VKQPVDGIAHSWKISELLECLTDSIIERAHTDPTAAHGGMRNPAIAALLARHGTPSPRVRAWMRSLHGVEGTKFPDASQDRGKGPDGTAVS